MITLTPVLRAALAAVCMSMQTIALHGDAALSRVPPAVMTITVAARMTIPSVTLMQGPA